MTWRGGSAADYAARPDDPDGREEGGRAAPGEGPVAVAVSVIEGRFPGVSVWFGRWTCRWWAYVPAGRRGRLVEAVTPHELAAAISAAVSGGDPATGVWR